MLVKAQSIAKIAHAGQFDKGGHPYMEHIEAVVAGVNGPKAKIAAYLHDVLEDTEITAEDLKSEGFTDEIIEAVKALTRNNDETYEEFIKRAGCNPIAREVKLADLANNMNLSRIPEPTEKDFKRIEKYRKASEYLNRL